MKMYIYYCGKDGLNRNNNDTHKKPFMPKKWILCIAHTSYDNIIHINTHTKCVYIRCALFSTIIFHSTTFSINSNLPFGFSSQITLTVVLKTVVRDTGIYRKLSQTYVLKRRLCVLCMFFRIYIPHCIYVFMVFLLIVLRTANVIGKMYVQLTIKCRMYNHI